MKALLKKAGYLDSNCISTKAVDSVKDLYRQVTDKTLLRKGIPVLESVAGAPDRAKKILLEEIKRSKDTWSHPQVAVKNLNLEVLGFKPTRIAIPLPGERIGSTSWRSGELHAHKLGDIFLVHKDSAHPGSLKGLIKHTIEDTSKAIRAMGKAMPPVLVKKKSCD